MYFSVTAKIKGLSKNVKASEICTLCGIQVKLYGDCFFSRVRDDKVNFERLNFTLQELSSDSNWIRLAFSQTKSPPQPSDEQKLMQMISQHQHEREQQRQQQPPPKPTPQHKCVACSKPAGLRCSRCRLVHYCSPLCQVTHWHIHKKVCKKAP
ncbi:hypothetical protein Pelo_19837 [Pelomyxa schiedti]|nr:hypothetical protein Pelo_19837 [Pelomyxa schiedti]